MAICLAVWAYCIFSKSLFVFASPFMVSSCLFITAVYVYITIVNAFKSDKLVYNDPLFWLCLSNLLYFGCDIPFMSLTDYWYKAYVSKEMKLARIDINGVLNMLRYLLLAISFLTLGLQKRSSLKPAHV